jgi:hypothetical protein
MAVPASSQEPPDFSLVLGGPLYQILRRTHLTGPVLELLQRRSCFLALVLGTLCDGQSLGDFSLTIVLYSRDSRELERLIGRSGIQLRNTAPATIQKTHSKRIESTSAWR